MAVVTPSFRITPAYDILLRGSQSLPVGLYQLQIATAEQLCRPHYSMGSLKAVKAKLRTLEDHGFVQHDAIPTKLTRSPYYYHLTRQGLNYLHDVGIDIYEGFRPDMQSNLHSLFIEHTLEINDVIISAALLEKSTPTTWLESFIHERTLKRKPCKISWSGNSFALIPDSFLTFRNTLSDGRQRRLPIVLEHDRGTEEEKHFRRRIRAYIVWLQTEGYKEMFKVGGVTIAFTTSAGTNRLLKMQEWTRRELATTNEALDIGYTFYFTSLDKPLKPGQSIPINPSHLWLGSCWYKVDSSEPLPLFGEVRND